MPIEAFPPVLKARKGQSVGAVLRKVGRPKAGDGNVGNANISRSGTTAAYLAARRHGVGCFARRFPVSRPHARGTDASKGAFTWLPLAVPPTSLGNGLVLTVVNSSRVVVPPTSVGN